MTLLDDLRIKGFRLSIEYGSDANGLLAILERAESLPAHPKSFPLIIHDLTRIFPNVWDMDNEEGGEIPVNSDYLYSIRNFGV
ncbi:hypothetical protein ACFYW1_38490 [Streptomyces sp. NPDC002669]|uniref:hypothetical protein n=1 Tax=unclassified Streptomyces TaxID=2593676 RepID=UPI00368D504F